MEFCMEWNVICRVCLQEGDMRSIFEKDSTNTSYAEKIMQCSNVHITSGTNLPENICETCLNNLNIAYEFRSACENSDSVLQSFTEGNLNDDSITTINKKDKTFVYHPPKGLKVKRTQIKVEVEELKEEFFEEETEYQVQSYAEQDEQGNYEHYEQEEFIDSEEDMTVEAREPSVTCVSEKFQNTSLPPIFKTEINRPKILLKKIKKQEKPTGRIDTRKAVTFKTAPVKKLYEKKPKAEKPPHSCNICGNVYKYKHALESHLKRHRNEKPWSCEICGRSFVLSVELRCHMRTHTGEKPYPCKFCGRRFADFGSRIKHERMHTGERPYVCETCGKAFAYSYGLSSHILTHTGEKNYHCELCSKRFTKKHHLKAHLKTHQKRGDILDINALLASQSAKSDKNIFEIHVNEDDGHSQIMSTGEFEMNGETIIELDEEPPENIHELVEREYVIQESDEDEQQQQLQVIEEMQQTDEEEIIA